VLDDHPVQCNRLLDTFSSRKQVNSILWSAGVISCWHAAQTAHPDADAHWMQETEEAATTAAQQAGWLRKDGSIAMEDVHTIISVRNGAKPQRQKLQLPDFMAKKLEEYRAMMNTSDDGGVTDDGKSTAAGS
jgi:hypothetical protein